MTTEITTMKLSPALKARWVKALRSGKFEQGDMLLKDKDGNFCCLGVLCAISKKVRDQTFEWDNLQGYLSDEGGTSVILDESMQNTLSIMNDRGCSFKQIASYIERSKKI